MTKDQLLNTLKSPGEIKSISSKLLLELKNQFPYSSTIQMLYAKALHCENSIYFESQLKDAALVCADRRKLYQLIHQTPLIEEIKRFDFEVEKSLESTPPTVVEEEIQQETRAKEEPFAPNKKIDQLEQNILVEAINSSIHSEILEYEKEIIASEETEPTSAEKPVLDEEKNSSKQPDLSNSKFSFDNWLDVSESKSSSKRAEIAGLVDQFISKKEENKKDTSTFFSASNLAKLSLVDKEEFVTETLAKIYADQDQFDKAIRAYEILSLKYPEKSVFFATRINKIRTKIKSK